MSRWVGSAALFLLVQLAGCISQIPTPEQFADGYIGVPVHRLLTAAMAPESYPYGVKTWPPYRPHPLPNGHSLYVIPSSPWCTRHVEADRSGIIVDIRRLDGCR